MKLKKLFSNLMLVTFLLGAMVSLTSCPGDPEVDPPPTPLEVTPTNISLLTDKGSSATFRIKTSESWSISNSSSWLNLSANSGSGETTITVTALSRNDDDVDRVAQVVVTAGNSSETVIITQLNAFISSKVTIDVNSMVKLNYSVAFRQSYSGDVSYYYSGYLEKSQSAGWTDEKIVSTLMNMTVKSPSESGEDEVMGLSGLYSNTDYYFCTVAFNSKGEQGKLQKYEFKTPAYQSNRPAVTYGSVTYSSYYWYWSTTIGPFASRYYMIAITGLEAWYLGAIQINDALAAWTIKDAVNSGELNPIVQNGSWNRSKASSDEDFYSASWAQDAYGNFAPQLDKVYRDISSSGKSLKTLEPEETNEVTIPISKLRSISKVYDSNM